jgi:hypothetical protein
MVGIEDDDDGEEKSEHRVGWIRLYGADALECVFAGAAIF